MARPQWAHVFMEVSPNISWQQHLARAHCRRQWILSSSVSLQIRSQACWGRRRLRGPPGSSAGKWPVRLLSGTSTGTTVAGLLLRGTIPPGTLTDHADMMTAVVRTMSGAAAETLAIAHSQAGGTPASVGLQDAVAAAAASPPPASTGLGSLSGPPTFSFGTNSGAASFAFGASSAAAGAHDPARDSCGHCVPPPYADVSACMMPPLQAVQQ